MEHIFSKENRPYVSNRLKSRTILFLVIAVALLGLMIYDTAIGEAVWWMVLLGLVVGLIIGFIYGRVSRVRWNESKNEVVRQNDAIGTILIIGYILLGIARDYLLKDLLSGTALLVVSFAVLSGVLFGRFFGMHISIMRVLREKRPGSQS